VCKTPAREYCITVIFPELLQTSICCQNVISVNFSPFLFLFSAVSSSVSFQQQLLLAKFALLLYRLLVSNTGSAGII